jgi:hypothetical protein
VSKGNWRAIYGDEHYLLAGLNVSDDGIEYPVEKGYDVTNFGEEDYAYPMVFVNMQRIPLEPTGYMPLLTDMLHIPGFRIDLGLRGILES